MTSHCGYITARYNPVRLEVLLGPARGINEQLATELQASLATYHAMHTDFKLRIEPIRSLYKAHYDYKDIAAHPAMIFLPYQISFMSFFEVYRMGVPIFIPSPKLLAGWHNNLGVLKERTWDRVYGKPGIASVIPRHKESKSTMQSDPNNEDSFDAILEWIKLADFYSFPFTIQFQSWDELIRLLQTTDLQAVSRSMLDFNRQEEFRIRNKWLDVLDKVIDRRQQSSFPEANVRREDVNDMLSRLYRYRLSNTCDGQEWIL